MWKAKIKDALPVAAAGLTFWITHGALVRFQSRYDDVCSILEQRRITYVCGGGDEYEMLTYTCIAASIFVGYLVWFIYCKPQSQP